MIGKKQKPNSKMADKKGKFDKKQKQSEDRSKKPQSKGKRKPGDSEDGAGAKRKRDKSVEVDEKKKDGDSKSGVKRSHDGDKVSDEGMIIISLISGPSLWLYQFIYKMFILYPNLNGVCSSFICNGKRSKDCFKSAIKHLT